MKVFSKCRIGRGSGVMLQVKQDLMVLKTLPSELDESVTTELKYKNVGFQVAGCLTFATETNKRFLIG